MEYGFAAYSQFSPHSRKCRVFIDYMLPRLREQLYAADHPDIAQAPETAARRPGV